MRLLSTLLLASLGALCVLAAAPANPPLESQHGDNGMCLLDGLSLTKGLELVPAFDPEIFFYKCNCADWSEIGTGAASPQVVVHHMDSLSHSEVWFNGVSVNTEPDFLTNSAQTSNPLATVGNPFKAGKNLIQILVRCGRGVCQYQYQIECDRPRVPGGGSTGDPQFLGLRGQSFQIHGVAGEIYNIVSDADLQYNSRFVFLNRGDCPVVDGRRQKGCWSHPGSYLGELGLKTRAGDRIHIVTGPASEGFANVEVNGRPLEFGETFMLAGDLGSVSRNSTHLASVQIGNWDFTFENSDMFLNQHVRVLDARTLRSHGLLGQTWREATYPNAIKYIQGSVDDYAIREKDIFGDNFVFNMHN